MLLLTLLLIPILASCSDTMILLKELVKFRLLQQKTVYLRQCNQLFYEPHPDFDVATRVKECKDSVVLKRIILDTIADIMKDIEKTVQLEETKYYFLPTMIQDYLDVYDTDFMRFFPSELPIKWDESFSPLFLPFFSNCQGCFQRELWRLVKLMVTNQGYVLEHFNSDRERLSLNARDAIRLYALAKMVRKYLILTIPVTDIPLYGDQARKLSIPPRADLSTVISSLRDVCIHRIGLLERLSHADRETHSFIFFLANHEFTMLQIISLYASPPFFDSRLIYRLLYIFSPYKATLFQRFRWLNY